MKFIRALYLIAALSASSTGMMAQTQSSGYFLHTITKGQSLYSIASMYNVTTGDIVKMNPGSDQKIKTGETLKIPQKNIGTEQQMFHTIQSGETLYKLTQRYGVTAQRICQAKSRTERGEFPYRTGYRNSRQGDGQRGDNHERGESRTDYQAGHHFHPTETQLQGYA